MASKREPPKGELTVDISPSDAKRLRRIRGKLTQRPFSKMIGTTHGTISNVENGQQLTLDAAIYAAWISFDSNTKPDIVLAEEAERAKIKQRVVKRLVRALAHFSIEELEALARYVELQEKRKNAPEL